MYTLVLGRTKCVGRLLFFLTSSSQRGSTLGSPRLSIPSNGGEREARAGCGESSPPSALAPNKSALAVRAQHVANERPAVGQTLYLPLAINSL